MSEERDVKLLVANEFLFSRITAKAVDDRIRNLWTMIRGFCYRYLRRSKIDEIEETFDGNTALLEICLEERDVYELKRLTVAMELFEMEIHCLTFLAVFLTALQIIFG